MRRILLVAALSLAGCVSTRPAAWWPTEPAFVARHAGFEVIPPAGWMQRWYVEKAGPARDTILVLPVGGAVVTTVDSTRWVRQDPETLLATRDGTSLQVIVAAAGRVGEPLGVGESDRVVLPGLTPHELAELFTDGLRMLESVAEVRVIESAPASLSGRPGFRLVTSIRPRDGLPRRIAVYGVVEGGRFYWLGYAAPERIFFDRDLPTFEAMVQSFRLVPPVPPKPSRRRRAR